MLLNNDFRKNLESSLKKSNTLLGQLSFTILEEAIDNEFRLIVDKISSKYAPFQLDIISSRDNIIDSLRKDTNLSLQLRSNKEDSFVQNEVRFDVVRPQHPPWGSNAQKEYSVSRENLEYDCEEQYWRNPKNIQAYENISLFRCFNDATFPNSEINKVKNSSYTYNLDGWRLFLESILKYLFPDFTFYRSKENSIFRLTRGINSSLFIGLEFNWLEMSAFLKAGEIDIPYLNIILFNEKFDLNQKSRPYIFSYSQDILSLGIFGNPFFYKPCFQLIGFAAVEMFHDKNMPFNMEHKYKTEYRRNTDDTFTVLHPQDYGEKLKKHAFFYLDALAYSSRSYLTFLEQCILSAL